MTQVVSSLFSFAMEFFHKKHRYVQVSTLEDVPRWELAVILGKYLGNGIVEDAFSGDKIAVLFSVVEPFMTGNILMFWIEQVDIQKSGYSRFNVLSFMKPRTAVFNHFQKMAKNKRWGQESKDDSWMQSITLDQDSLMSDQEDDSWMRSFTLEEKEDEMEDKNGDYSWMLTVINSEDTSTHYDFIPDIIKEIFKDM